MSLMLLLAAIAADPATELTAIDQRQKQMVADADIAGLERLADPRLRINAPTGRVLDHAAFFRNMRSGAIAAEAFSRTIEDVAITGDVGVVMGRETFTPTASSELGKTYGARPLQRRFTNIYLRRDQSWRWLARHANVVPEPRP